MAGSLVSSVLRRLCSAQRGRPKLVHRLGPSFLAAAFALACRWDKLDRPDRQVRGHQHDSKLLFRSETQCKVEETQEMTM